MRKITKKLAMASVLYLAQYAPGNKPTSVKLIKPNSSVSKKTKKRIH